MTCVRLVPLCGKYDKTINCCTMYSVSADLHSDMCLRANGCQDNCADDPGVKVPASASTPTTTLSINSDYPTPTPTNYCGNCTDTQCCSAAVSPFVHRSDCTYLIFYTELLRGP